ncbi:MAG: hypothetical protein FGM52_06070, partial [Mycobacterium sp.]|nr:hypothetical protein [Mycobacterium sp.]
MTIEHITNTLRAIARIGTVTAAVGIGALSGGLGVAAADSPEEPGSTGSEISTPRTDAAERPRGRSGARRSAPIAEERVAPADGRPVPPRQPRPSTAATQRNDVPPALDKSAASHPAASTRIPQAGPAAAIPVTVPAVPVTAAPEQPAAAAAVTAVRSAAGIPVWAVAQPARIPAPAAARTLVPTVRGFLNGLLAPLSGMGSGSPMESPAAWVMLSAVRRLGRPAQGATAASTVTSGQQVLPAATTAGTTTPITWAWGTNPVLNFNPATDKLDFGWMQANQFDVSENSGSTVIAVVGNNHSYTLRNVPVAAMQMSNIVAKDTGTVSKWQGLISTAQTAIPTLSIANTAVSEGNSGTSNASFAVTLSKPSTKSVTVAYATANGTATAGQDYTAAAGTLTFAPGVTSQQVAVKITGDATVEPDETFTVTLSNPVGARLATVTATGTIRNDDATPATPPTVSIANSAVVEGNSGTIPMAFTVSLSKASDKTVTVGYGTSNGTATAGQDYTAAAGTLTFAPGATTQSLAVAVVGDTAVEPTETFTVTLANPVGASLGTATATGTITNDDSAT